ncbi:catechol 2,3-dioxygenase-like lactoylglutathione lyase family enzyme [Conyzicola lurida]|uniref:Catechol 2,3-dioxygenase-like lactoylglutathione lyase family enzyme n=1 Tax=Conyzicola lurida TaxID=1172621 RepID=A0A841AJD0_9MICO|nr:VOC family protein [Conyzicola lurida]MBB5844010.1 catechol 2,3-dioxygenase-like lactoylglutathione lyase family enzyme [Conyzicola lurida]
MTRVLRLHHVAIVVQDLEASTAWYSEHFGFVHQYDYSLPGSRATMLVHGEARIELIQAEGSTPITPQRQDVGTTLRSGGVNHLALGTDDLEATIALLEAAGVEIVIRPADVPNDSGDRFAFIRDNERMLVELLQPAV